ncbi:hypothetical protein D9611_001255 [Ephemerocybe angulata]|uniref:Uncharacterized protein n=1 Tax=Ephemerocybe angulata TaxID=980116 RepID=A0A8H5CI63_9AGAR|nr:hypothetical protein D9611_001255 [Tulosesus angulatus]
MKSLHILSFLALPYAAAVLGAQIPLKDPFSREPWRSAGRAAGSARWRFDVEPSPNATENYVFETVASLLQQWPNTRYRNGNIVPATIPVGTLLYHGTDKEKVPDNPNWVATDPEHSFLFCRTVEEGKGCWHLTLAATRPLNVLYFDGSSAAKMPGTMDAQDVLRGKVEPGRLFDEVNRIMDLCKWGKKYNLDGFMRMEMDFEIMLCDFTQGVEVASFLNLHSLQPGIPGVPNPKRIGNLPGTLLLQAFRVLEAGKTHDRFPGETRAKLDLTRLTSFYDTDMFPSLVAERYGQERWDHRVAQLGADGREQLLSRLDDVLSSTGKEQVGSGVDWTSLIRVIIHRHADRLEILRYMLNSTDEEVAKTLADIHDYTTSMLDPYILHGVRPINASSASIEWAAPIFEVCASTHTKIISTTLKSKLTYSETLILGAVDGVLHEICRVVVGIWAEGVVLQLPGAESRPAEDVITDWSARVDKLMKWLDWSVWVKCNPGCSFEETCYLPTWPWLHVAWPHRPPLPPRPPRKERDIIPGGLERKWDRLWGWVEDFSGAVDEDYYRRPQPKCIRRVFPLVDL